MGLKIHAIWHESSLHLWAEARGSTQSTAAGADRTDELRTLLGELSAEPLLASVASTGSLTLWVPDTAGDTTTPSLKEFAVTTLVFKPADALDLLVSLTDPACSSCDDSILYWVQLARFVAECLSRQQFYPDLETTLDGSYVAHWRLLAAMPETVAALERFALAMPLVCRSVVNTDADASHLIESFMMATCDAVVRRDVSNDPFFNRAAEKSVEPFAPPEIHWLAALLGTDRTLRGSSDDHSTFADQVRGWIGRLDDGRLNAPWRLCLTLHEPDEPAETPVEDPIEAPEDGWLVTFQLQSQEDESEVIDADTLFADAGAAPTILGRSVLDRRAQLLSELTRAAEAFPPLERILTNPAPIEIPLSTTEAHAFIRQWAPALLERDFRVFLPDWASRTENDFGLLLAVRPDEEAEWDDEILAEQDGEGNGRAARNGKLDISTGKFGLESLLHFNWQIAVGNLRMTPEEFQRLLAKRAPLVKFNGRWLQLDHEAAQTALDYIQRNQTGEMTLGQALRVAFSTTKADAGLPIMGLTGSSWVEHFLEQSPSTRVEDMVQPEMFKGSLRPYQLRGLQWLAFLDRLGIGGCLADDMGLGKTIQLIALLLDERQAVSSNGDAKSDKPLGPTLLFAPTSVVGNWVREIERFAPNLRVLIHHGADRLSGDLFVETCERNDVVITSYALAHRDIEDLRRPKWRRIALDEAQKIKNPSSASSVAIRSLAAPRRIAMTGTPIENHLSELWSIMEMLNPGLLGSAIEFRERFAVPIEKLGDKDRVTQLRSLIRPFVLRRTKSDPQVAGDLPEKMEMKVYCNLTTEQAGIYERITGEMLERIDAAAGIRRRGLILAALTRLKQVCDHPALLTKDTEPLSGRSGKCERLVEMLEEVLEEGDAALIFTQYREMGHLLEKILHERLKVPTQFLHGGTPAKMRDAMIERFQKPNSDIRIFLLSLRAGGLGLNLTAANHVFHFDRWWNPAVESQATDRAHRLGQTRTVQVHKFVCVGTMEERIDKLLTDKLALADRIVSSGDEWLTNLSTDELRQYLSLSREAVGEF